MNIFKKYISQRDFLGGKGLKDSLWVKVALGAFLLAAITAMFPRRESAEASGAMGSVWMHKDLMAEFSFPILRDGRQYERERSAAAQSVYPVFERHAEFERAQTDSLSSVMRVLRAACEARRSWKQSGRPEDSVNYRRSALSLPLRISEREWDGVGRLLMTETKKVDRGFRRFEEALLAAAGDIHRKGIIDARGPEQNVSSVALRKGTTEEIIPVKDFTGALDVADEARTRLIASLGDQEESVLGARILSAVLSSTIILNAQETARAVQLAQDQVPRTNGFVREGERIVGRYERVTPEVALKISSYQRAKAERAGDGNGLSGILGALMHVTLIVGLFTFYLMFFRKRIFRDNSRLALIALLMLMVSAAAYITVTIESGSPLEYLIIVPAASMLLTIIFDSRVGFYGTVTLAFLVAGIRGNDYAIALGSLVAGALAAYSVRDLRHRTQIFRSLFGIFLGYTLTILAFSFERFDSGRELPLALTFALANGIVSPVLTYGLLIFLERVFRVTTDLTLAELSDLSHPLLHQLSEKAPGSFHHSVTVGNLSEAAAEAIGANPILARVGAYYHDIGKVSKPEYFIENQVGNVNRHSRLKPRMSALIITSHIKEGLEIGRVHGLPEKILDFIPQHHGTTRISFFFDKALKQAAAKPNPKDIIREEDFRYPGPKPQSKEAAIVMLADLVDAKTRTISEMTPQKLENTIENLIKQRFIEGQLDDCELTMKDLTKIKVAFLKILIGIHHHRINYIEEVEEMKAVPAAPAAPASPPPPPPASVPVASAAVGSLAAPKPPAPPPPPQAPAQPEAAAVGSPPAPAPNPPPAAPAEAPSGTDADKSTPAEQKPDGSPPAPGKLP